MEVKVVCSETLHQMTRKVALEKAKTLSSKSHVKHLINLAFQNVRKSFSKNNTWSYII